jgi:hypothetical protein
MKGYKEIGMFKTGQRVSRVAFHAVDTNARLIDSALQLGVSIPVLDNIVSSEWINAILSVIDQGARQTMNAAQIRSPRHVHVHELITASFMEDIRRDLDLLREAIDAQS